MTQTVRIGGKVVETKTLGCRREAGHFGRHQDRDYFPTYWDQIQDSAE